MMNSKLSLKMCLLVLALTAMTIPNAMADASKLRTVVNVNRFDHAYWTSKVFDVGSVTLPDESGLQSKFKTKQLQCIADQMAALRRSKAYQTIKDKTSRVEIDMHLFDRSHEAEQGARLEASVTEKVATLTLKAEFRDSDDVCRIASQADIDKEINRAVDALNAQIAAVKADNDAKAAALKIIDESLAQLGASPAAHAQSGESRLPEGALTAKVTLEQPIREKLEGPAAVKAQ